MTSTAETAQLRKQSQPRPSEKTAAAAAVHAASSLLSNAAKSAAAAVAAAAAAAAAAVTASTSPALDGCACFAYTTQFTGQDRGTRVAGWLKSIVLGTSLFMLLLLTSGWHTIAFVGLF